VVSLGPFTPALELAEALRARRLSAAELLEACLSAVDDLNPRLNAVIWRNDDEARAAAAEADRGLAGGQGEAQFLGVPIPIKDITPVARWPVTFGSRGAPAGTSDESELAIEALVRVGFVLCGRTNTPEFGLITATENSRYGITRNPWDTERSAGGSSGGAAAAVAAGMFPVAHGTDGGGSMRIPASYCGLVGFKSSRGRVPRLAQSWLGAVVDGVLARTVADSAAALDAIAGFDPLVWFNAPVPVRPFAQEAARAPRPQRIRLMDRAPLGLPTDDACIAAARSAAETLEELGHTVEEGEVPTISEQMIGWFVTVTMGGLAEFDGVDWSAVEPHVVSQRARAGALGAYDYAFAARALELLSRRETARWGRDFDLLLTPTSALLPPVAGTLLEAQHAAPEEPVLDLVRSVAFTAFANITGLPAVSLPLEWTDLGLPVGIQLMAGPWEDAELFAVAAQLESARPWSARRPPSA
jgi:amidase